MNLVNVFSVKREDPAMFTSATLTQSKGGEDATDTSWCKAHALPTDAQEEVDLGGEPTDKDFIIGTLPMSQIEKSCENRTLLWRQWLTVFEIGVFHPLLEQPALVRVVGEGRGQSLIEIAAARAEG